MSHRTKRLNHVSNRLRAGVVWLVVASVVISSMSIEASAQQRFSDPVSRANGRPGPETERASAANKPHRLDKYEKPVVGTASARHRTTPSGALSPESVFPKARSTSLAKSTIRPLGLRSARLTKLDDHIRREFPPTRGRSNPDGVHKVRIALGGGNETPSADTYVQYPTATDHSTEEGLKVGTLDSGRQRNRALLKFAGLESRLQNRYISTAKLNLWALNRILPDSQCVGGRGVLSLHPIEEPWDAGTASYPGPRISSPIARSTTGFVFDCDPKWRAVELDEAGIDLINRWTHQSAANNGIALVGSSSDRRAYQEYGSSESIHQPFLEIAYSDYGATYRMESTALTKHVTPTQDGAAKVTVTNLGLEGWDKAAGYKLSYKIYDAATHEYVDTVAAQTALPVSVGPNGTVTVNATLGKLPAGSYTVEWDMVNPDGRFFSEFGVKTFAMALSVPASAPTITGPSPSTSDRVASLTPFLSVTTPLPGSTTTYTFKVCGGSPAAPVACSDSGAIAARGWAVPGGKLDWGTTYFWQVTAKIGTVSTTLGPIYFVTDIPQPAVTKYLASAQSVTDDDPEKPFDPQVGNFTTSAVDATIQVAGPDLRIRRTYNSLDPRRDLAFGYGWNSDLDTRLLVDGDSLGGVTLRTPSGREVRFGRNPSGKYVPPGGYFATLISNTDGTWKLVEKTGSSYTFNASGRPIATASPNGLSQTRTYDASGALTLIKDMVSGRSLKFTWAGARVATVSTNPVAGAGTELVWKYTYVGANKLTSACDPQQRCTSYEYGAGSHYRSSVADSAPQSYYRFDELSGSVAISENDANLRWDQGQHVGTTLGQAGAQAGPYSRSAKFNGASSYVKLVDNLARNLGANLAVEMWFKTAQAGGTLLATQRQAMDDTAGPVSGYWPVLYVGTDGKLRAQLRDGAAAPIATAAVVNDDKWHHVVLQGAVNKQTLYVDGVYVGEKVGIISLGLDESNTYVGAGFSKGWPNAPTTNIKGYFNGYIDEVAVYSRAIGAPAISSHYAAARNVAELLKKVTLPSGKSFATVQMDNERERLSSFTDVKGGVWRLDRPTIQASGDSIVREVLVTDPSETQLRYKYDAKRQGRIIEFSLGQNLGRKFEYDSGGYVSRITDLSDKIFGDLSTDITHDERGNVLSKSDWESVPIFPPVTTYKYYFNAANAVDPRNDKVIEVRDPRSTDELDNRYLTKNTLNAQGLLVDSTGPATSDFPAGRVTKRTYTTTSSPAYGGGLTPAGLQELQTTPGQAVTKTQYRSNGDVGEVTDQLGKKVRFVMDGIGRVVSKVEVSDSYPAGVTTGFAYDSLSRPVRISSPVVADRINGGNKNLVTSFAYDPDGNLVTKTENDQAGSSPRAVTSEFDAFNNLIRSSDATGFVAYTYDNRGQRKSSTDQNGVTREFQYDERQMLIEEVLKGWTGSPGQTGSPVDLVTDSYSYDDKGRLTTHWRVDGEDTGYTYKNGKIGGVHSDGGNVDFTYDKAGNVLTAESRETGLRMTRVVDAANRVVSSITQSAKPGPNAISRKTTTSYNADDFPLRVVSTGDTPGSQVSVFERNKVGLPTSESVGDATTSLKTTWTYDQRGLPLSMTSPNGNVAGTTAESFTTRYEYDEVGQQVRATSPSVVAETLGGSAGVMRPVTTTSYNVFGQIIAEQNPLGFITQSTYDANGRLAEVTRPEYTPVGASAPVAPRTLMGYDLGGRLTSVSITGRGTTNASYDELGHLVKIVDPPMTAGAARGEWRFEYDAQGRPLRQVDPTGATHDSTFDLAGRKTSDSWIEDVAGGPVKHTASYEFTPAGDLAKATSAEGVINTFGYNDAGERTSERDGANNLSTFSYDFLGRPLTDTDPLRNVFLRTYDFGGRVTAEKSSDSTGAVLRSTSSRYDANGNVTGRTDGRGFTTSYEVDALGRMNKQVEPVSETSSITTTFGFDAAGNATRITDGRGNATWRTYNSLGLVESLVEPSTTAHPALADRTFTTTYDLGQRPAVVREPGGVERRRVYDAGGGLLSETGSGAEAETATRGFTYDLAGRIISSSSGAATSTFSYDSGGRLRTMSGASGNSSLSYDGDSRLVERADASGKTVITYDAAGRVASLLDPLNATKQVRAYDALGRVKTATFGDTGPVRTFTYDGLGRLRQDVLTARGGTAIAGTEYGFATSEDLLTSKRTTGQVSAGETTYTYDRSGRILTAASPGKSRTYGWDAAGNRTSTDSRAATFDERNRLLSDGQSTYSYTPRGTRSAKSSPSGAEAYKFDAFSRLVNRGTTAFSYDAMDRLTSSNGSPLAYGDASNRVVSDSTGKYSYGADGEVLGLQDQQGSRLALQDRHGDIVGGFDASAGTTLTNSSSYDPFGVVENSAGAIGKLGYQGGWTESPTGLVNMHSRWFDPGAGGFISRDDFDVAPVPSVAGNRYSYGNADPLSNTDPSGHCPFCLILLAPVAPTAVGWAVAGTLATAAAVGGVVLAARNIGNGNNGGSNSNSGSSSTGTKVGAAGSVASLKIPSINININMGNLNLGNLSLNMPSINIGNLDFSLGDLGLDNLNFDIADIGDINIPEINIGNIDFGDLDFDFDFSSLENLDISIGNIDVPSIGDIDIPSIGDINIPDIDIGKVDMKDLGISGVGAIGSDLAGKVGDPCGSSTPSEDACDLGKSDIDAGDLSDLADAADCPADESALSCATSSLGVRGVPWRETPWSPTHGELNVWGLTDSHHIMQQAAVKNVPGYKENVAPAIQLIGPSNVPGTPHNLATRIQRQPGGGTYAEERHLAVCALYAAGCSEEEIVDAMRRVDLYFKGELKLKDNSPLRYPLNRKKKK